MEEEVLENIYSEDVSIEELTSKVEKYRKMYPSSQVRISLKKLAIVRREFDMFPEGDDTFFPYTVNRRVMEHTFIELLRGELEKTAKPIKFEASAEYTLKIRTPTQQKPIILRCPYKLSGELDRGDDNEGTDAKEESTVGNVP